MKKTLLISMLIGYVVVAFAQPTLTYDTHRLLAGTDNPMTLCEYMSPGKSGENITWDFSGLLAKKDFIGTIKNPIINASFNTSNTQLVEFGTNFFFEIDETGIYQTGYASSDLNTIVEYSQPFVKMEFPFSYKDSYSKPFSGEYYYKEKEMGEISGIGQVEADAWGKLILPNNTIYEKTIRVKTTKTYTTSYTSSTSKSSVEIITYRWYNSTHRYPLLVFSELKTISGTRTSTNYQAAYNNNAFKKATIIEEEIALGNEGVRVYPNPSETELYIEVNSENSELVEISIYDISGKLVVGKQKRPLVTGINTIDLSSNLGQLKPGSYLMNVDTGEKVIVKDLIVVN